MPFQVPLRHKFGCICLTNAAVDRDLREPLGPRRWFVGRFRRSPRPGTPLADVAWLGENREFRTSCWITLLAHRASNNPGILDDENESLVKDAFSLFLAILVCEIFHHDGGMILSGANNGGDTDIRET